LCHGFLNLINNFLDNLWRKEVKDFLSPSAGGLTADEAHLIDRGGGDRIAGRLVQGNALAGEGRTNLVKTLTQDSSLALMFTDPITREF